MPLASSLRRSSDARKRRRLEEECKVEEDKVREWERRILVVTWYQHRAWAGQGKRWRRNLSSHLRALNIL